MPAAPILSDDEIAERLRALPGWERAGSSICRTFTLKDFREALGLVERIADPADEQNHHPDVAIHWNALTFTLWTHASGGITERDFRLAEAIDKIAESYP